MHFKIVSTRINRASTAQEVSRVAVVVDGDLKKVDDLIKTVTEKLGIQHLEPTLHEAYTAAQTPDQHQEGNTLKHHLAYIQKQRLAGLDNNDMQAILDGNQELADQFILFHDTANQATVGYSFQKALFAGTEDELMPSKKLAKLRKKEPDVYERQIALQKKLLGPLKVDKLVQLGVSITHFGHAEASADFVVEQNIANPDSLLAKAVRYHMDFLSNFTKPSGVKVIQRLIKGGLTPEEIKVIAVLATLDLLGCHNNMTKDEKYALWNNVNESLEAYEKQQQEKKAKTQVEVPKGINALLGSKLKGNYRKFQEKWPSILGVLKNTKMPSEKKQGILRNILSTAGLSKDEIEIVLSNFDKITEIAGLN